MIKAVLFDVIGTTVKSADPDFIINCFIKAFHQYQIDPNVEIIIANRGKDKMTMIHEILSGNALRTELALPIFHTFNNIVSQNIKAFSEMEGVTEVFQFLKDRNIAFGIGTGLSYDLFTIIYDHLAWSRYKFAYQGIAEVIGKSRPDPAMIYDMMEKLGIRDPDEVLKIGDTVADIQEGKNAGVHTAVLLSGTQDENVLLNELPDYWLKSLHDVKTLDLFQ